MLDVRAGEALAVVGLDVEYLEYASMNVWSFRVLKDAYNGDYVHLQP